MGFVTTWLAVAGILSTAIPIIIHLLLRNRRKTYEWAAMSLLIEALRRHRRRARIESFLLLALRCLAVLLIGTALAQPIIRGSLVTGMGDDLVVIIIDDGIVSGVRHEDGTTDLDRNVSQAIELIDSLSPGTSLALVGTSRSGEALIEEPTLNKERARKILRSLEPVPTSSDILGAMRSTRDLIGSHSKSIPCTVVMFGSHRKGSFSTSSNPFDFNPIDRLGWDEREKLELLTVTPTNDPVSLLAIDSISLRKPLDIGASSSTMIADIELRRLGDSSESMNNMIRMDGIAIDGTSPRSVVIPKGRDRSSIQIEIFLRPEDAAKDGSTIIDAFVDERVLPGVSRHSLVTSSSRNIRVGLIDRDDFIDDGGISNVTSMEWMTRSLDPARDGIISIDPIDPVSIDDRRIETFDAVIVNRPDLLSSSGWNTLERFSEAGGFILFTPPTDALVHGWLEEFKSTFDQDLKFNPETVVLTKSMGLSNDGERSDLLSRIDDEMDELVSPISVSRLLDIDDSSAKRLLLCTDGRPFLQLWGSNERRAGSIALFSASPTEEWTNLPVKPLMVPLMQELIRKGSTLKSRARSLYSGSILNVATPSAREIVSEDGDSITLDRNRNTLRPLVRTGGWRVLDSTGRTISSIAVNPDLDACDPTPITSERVREWFEGTGSWKVSDFNDIKSVLSELRENSRLSFALLLIAMTVILAETFLNRRFSNNRVRTSIIRSDGGARHA
ncbi:MAG: hypothetical protein CMJ40_02865 [Phycisphaerae bacterium]|nr:hypothetical protein [Phycisphaerae bacterium]